MNDDDRSAPCVRHDCHACCVGTRMTLTEADLVRLERHGCRPAYRRTKAGYLRLVNIDGHCAYLENCRCSVYQARPEGCMLYPLVWDEENGRAVLDDFCPHRHEFEFTALDEDRLRRSVETEEAEAEARLKNRGD